MRFIVEEKQTNAEHPQWPDETHYYVVDLMSGRATLGCYTTYEAAKAIADAKNG